MADSFSIAATRCNLKRKTEDSNEQCSYPDVSFLEPATSGSFHLHESETRIGSFYALFSQSISTKIFQQMRAHSPDTEKARIFKYTELAIATENFKSHHNVCLGHGRFGSTFKGKVTADDVLAVKKLNPLNLQSEDEFVADVLLLSQLSHPNLVDLIGYCAEGNNRLLVFKYMPLGSLQHYLHGTDKQPLDWNRRLKIAAGVARGIDYLHSFADPSILAGGLTLSNILLDEGFNPKLSDFWLSKLCRVISSSHASTVDMSASIYRAPEFVSTGQVTSMSNTYSFGVILLEIISGRKVYDDTRNSDETSLVRNWRKVPRSRPNRRSMLQFADPKLNDVLSELELCKVLELASMCVRDNAKARPSMKLVAATLDKIIKEDPPWTR